MRNFLKFFSAFLIMVIGFNLMVEISHTSETIHSDLKNNSYSYQAQSNPINDISSTQTGCQESCHLGVYHLCHCFQVPQVNFEYIRFFSATFDPDPIYINFLSADSPCLEGLRRPPRIS